MPSETQKAHIESGARHEENNAESWLDNAEIAGQEGYDVLEVVYLHRMWICLFEAALIRDEG